MFKKSRVLPPEFTCLDPANRYLYTENDLPANLFLLYILPKSVTNHPNCTKSRLLEACL